MLSDVDLSSYRGESRFRIAVERFDDEWKRNLCLKLLGNDEKLWPLVEKCASHVTRTM